MNESDMLKITSQSVFEDLETGEIWILKFLARHGPMNLNELGINAPKGGGIDRTSFDRWGVKKRLTGSKHFTGLIPANYIYEVKLNKKETKYCLTIKGIFASLATTKFENIFQIKQYYNVIKQYCDDKKLIELIMNYIKSEVSFILYFNYLQGANWTNFRTLFEYISSIEEDFHSPMFFPLQPVFIKQSKSKQLDFFRIENMKLFYAVHASIPFFYPNSDLIFNISNKKYQPTKNEREQIILTILTKYWFHFLDEQKIDIDIFELARDLFLYTNPKITLYSDDEEYAVLATSEAKKYLKEKGFSSSVYNKIKF